MLTSCGYQAKDSNLASAACPQTEAHKHGSTLLSPLITNDIFVQTMEIIYLQSMFKFSNRFFHTTLYHGRSVLPVCKFFS